MTLTPGVYPVAEGTVVAVVTALVLEPLPETALPPLPAGVTAIRETLDIDAYRALFRDIGEQWFWVSRLRIDDAELSDILTSPDVHTLVLRRDGDAIGLVELDLCKPAAQLSFFGLVPGATGQGLGRAAMGLAKHYAAGHGATSLHLTTCTLDAPWALAFYQKHGFRTISRSVEVMEDPRLTGHLAPDVGAVHAVL